MGMVKLFSSSSYDERQPVTIVEKIVEKVRRVPAPNPNPRNFEIIRAEEIGKLIVMVRYPDCTNYEGLKILMFEEDVTLHDLTRQGTIDPHFSDNPNMISPIARFAPTKEGWELAEMLALLT